MLKTLHLTSSRFFGGPERQMLGLATAGREMFATSFASFSENGLCREFLRRATSSGFPAIELANDTPRLLRVAQELKNMLVEQKIDILLCHGYKAGLVGWRAARRAGVPVVAVSRGWTGENRKVQFYEWLDRRSLRNMDCVICVSQAQADRVRRCGVDQQKIFVIPNSIDSSRFEQSRDSARYLLDCLWNNWKSAAGDGQLQALHQGSGVSPGHDDSSEASFTIGAAGRLSPEKGFDLLIKAAGKVIELCPQSRFVLFGDGPLRMALQEQIATSGLTSRFLLAGFKPDLDKYLPALDMFVQSSHTEGMPNVILEALAAGVPVVATAVGGTPEVITHGESGDLVPPSSPEAIARAVVGLAGDDVRRSRYSRSGKQVIASQFGFGIQALSYREVFLRLVRRELTGFEEPANCRSASAAGTRWNSPVWDSPQT